MNALLRSSGLISLSNSLYFIDYFIHNIFFLANSDGIPIRSTLSPEDTDNYAALVSQLAIKAAGVVRTLDDSDELAFLRIRFVYINPSKLNIYFIVYITLLRVFFPYFLLSLP